MSSANALGASLWFLIQVLSLLAGAFSGSLPLHRIYMLGWVAISGATLYQTRLGVGSTQMFKSKLLFWGGETESACLSMWVLWSGPARSWCVSSGQPLLPTSNPWSWSWAYWWKAFLWEGSFSSLLVSPRWLNALLFSPGCLSKHTTPLLSCRPGDFAPFIRLVAL
jgi:hypothetical protein